MSSYLSVSASFCLSLSSLPHFLSLPIYPLLSFFLFFSFEFVLYILISNQLYHEEIGKGTIIDYILCSGIAGDPGLIPGLGRSPGEGIGYSLQYLGLPLFLSWLRIHLQCERPEFNPWVGKTPWRREKLPTPVFWPGEFHGLHIPWGRKESDRTVHVSLSLSLYEYITLIIHLSMDIWGFFPHFSLWWIVQLLSVNFLAMKGKSKHFLLKLVWRWWYKILPSLWTNII